MKKVAELPVDVLAGKFIVQLVLNKHGLVEWEINPRLNHRGHKHPKTAAVRITTYHHAEKWGVPTQSNSHECQAAIDFFTALTGLDGDIIHDRLIDAGWGDIVPKGGTLL